MFSRSSRVQEGNGADDVREDRSRRAVADALGEAHRLLSRLADGRLVGVEPVLSDVRHG